MEGRFARVNVSVMYLSLTTLNNKRSLSEILFQIRKIFYRDFSNVAATCPLKWLYAMSQMVSAF